MCIFFQDSFKIVRGLISGSQAVVGGSYWSNVESIAVVME
ncbi:hypothetical protein Q648_01316 [Bartonella quintana JK 12]|nr:hypothetical protein Q648_01316 [Bartonella quintana JK 12]ETS17377.1 hypothetical protein Q647_01330 [Bartonella quintana JK 7]